MEVQAEESGAGHGLPFADLKCGLIFLLSTQRCAIHTMRQACL